jgi:hypothetical protein
MADNLTVSIQHPTNVSQVAKVSVSPEITPRYMVEEMVKAAWLPQPGTGGQYKLRNPGTGLQLLDDVGLAAAGVTTGALLTVDHTTTGA